VNWGWTTISRNEFQLPERFRKGKSRTLRDLRWLQWSELSRSDAGTAPPYISGRTLLSGWLHVAFPCKSFVLLEIMSGIGGPLWAPTQCCEYLPYVAGMVADTELALDQISHTQTGPGALFIAQCFSTFSQQNMKPFPVLLVHLRFASSSTRFL